jgi:hypothetical protein
MLTPRLEGLPTPRQWQRRDVSSSIYGVGEGWTGALGTGRIDQTIRGHFDDLEDETDDAVSMDLPITVANSSATKVHAAAVGWGHTAVILSSDLSVASECKRDDALAPQLTPQLYVTGRPHEFSSLLRLRRLPRWLRNYSVRQTLRSTAVSPAELDGDASSSYSSLRRMMDPTSAVGRLVTYLSESFLDQSEEHWDKARTNSFLPRLTQVSLPSSYHVPISVSCSAGLTAVVTESGHLYALGLNQFGQCGNGRTSNNVWTPTLVTGLSSEVATGGPRSALPQSFPVTSVSLGLQHGLCLNAEGEVFTFGKGHRGQLGQDASVEESHTALPIRKACRVLEDGSNRPVYVPMPKVVQISSGMLHAAVLTEDREVFVFGKNMLRESLALADDAAATDDDANVSGGKSGSAPLATADARLPIMVQGLPQGRTVTQIASGSHHTSMMLDDGSVWCVGISSDTRQHIHDPVELVSADVAANMLPLRQFAAHMDRTTLVGNDGRTVLQVHLWSDPDLREYAAFSPAWIDRLLADYPDLRIRQVHRSWIHSLVVADR